MNTAILLHGKPGKDEYYNPTIPSASNFHWFPWLQKQLLIHGIAAQTPEVPNSWKPEYETITSETILVGHSCGAGFIVRWLSEHKDVIVGKVVLVAPWLDPNRKDTTDFFDFTIDPQLVNRTAGITIFHSDNDMASIHKSVTIIRDTIKDVVYREFHNYGHFCIGDMGTSQFSELLEELL